MHRLSLFSTVDAVLISRLEPTNDNNFYCFTGITKAAFHYGIAVLLPDGIHLIVAAMEEEEAKATGYKYSLHGKGILKKILKGRKNIGIDGTKFPYNEVVKLQKKGFNVIDVSHDIQAARVVKNTQEITSMRAACTIVSTVADHILSWVKPGMTELELAARIEYEMKLLGSADPAFETIVAFGSNSADPHHKTDSTTLKENQFILCDFGATVDFLRSDITRTYYFGTPTDVEKKVYNTVLKVQLDAIKKLPKGKNLMKTAVQEINATLKEMKLNGSMCHSLGHGLGFDVHEDRLVNKANVILPPGAITTVEPGAYIPGKFGVRIEDDILITEHGYEVLTTAKKEQL